MLMEFKTLNKQFWGRHLWARGYFESQARAMLPMRW